MTTMLFKGHLYIRPCPVLETQAHALLQASKAQSRGQGRHLAHRLRGGCERGQIPEHANTEATGPGPMSCEFKESRGGQPVAGEAGTLCLLQSSCRARARSRQHPLRNPSSGAKVL